MNVLRLDADFLSLLCSCAHLLAIEGNEVLILDLLWQSSAFQVKDSPDLYSIKLVDEEDNIISITDFSRGDTVMVVLKDSFDEELIFYYPTVYQVRLISSEK